MQIQYIILVRTNKQIKQVYGYKQHYIQYNIHLNFHMQKRPLTTMYGIFTFCNILKSPTLVNIDTYISCIQNVFSALR